MRLTYKDQLLEGGVVPERLRKRPGPLVPDVVACEGPRHTRIRTHTHTHTHSPIHQCKSGGGEREPRLNQTLARPHAGGRGRSSSAASLDMAGRDEAHHPQGSAP